MATRFDKCVKKVSKRPGVTSPKGLCAAIGRKKYGVKGMAKLAAAGRKKAKAKANPQVGERLTPALIKTGRKTVKGFAKRVDGKVRVFITPKVLAENPKLKKRVKNPSRFHEIGYYEKVPYSEKHPSGRKYIRIRHIDTGITESEAWELARREAGRLGHGVVLVGGGSPVTVAPPRVKNPLTSKQKDVYLYLRGKGVSHSKAYSEALSH